jgi:superfamily I DNA/RNA helicase
MLGPWLSGVRGTQVLPLIESDEHVIRVEAGPGAGKTFGLVRRVQRLVHPEGGNVEGNEILVVAFNRVIAQSLRNEVSLGLAGSPHSGDPKVETLHALCLRIIGRDLRILMPHERDAMLYDVMQLHADLKTTYETHAKLDQALRDHEARHQVDLVLWHAVQEWLVRHHAQLISDVPGLLLDRLATGDLPSERYQHIIVDEFQDLTAAEQQIMVELLLPGGSLVALGDRRQSIYRFRGNDLDGLEKLAELVGVSEAEIIDVSMTECQRCPAEIVAASNALMVLSSAAPMVPTSTRTANTHVVRWNTPYKEAIGMAKAIAENVRAHPDESHLVMVTRRSFGYMLRKQLLALNPDLVIDLSFQESLLETWSVREAFLLFNLLVDPDAPTWRAWLGYTNSETGQEYKAANRNAGSYLAFLTRCHDAIAWETVEALSSEGRTTRRGAGGVGLWERASRAIQLREDVGELGDDLRGWVTNLFNAGRWISGITVDADEARIDLEITVNKTIEIIDAILEEHPDITQSNLARRVAGVLRYQIATKEPFAPSGNPDIQVSTLWGAKGVTADHVYVLGLFDEVIPGSRRSEYPGTDDEYIKEQRRLFYVSITRAKSTLVLSRPDKIKRTDADRMGIAVSSGNNQYPYVEVSRFLREILEHLPQGIDGESWAGPVI